MKSRSLPMSLLSDSLCRILLHKTESGRLGSRRFSPPKSRFGGEKGVSISLTGQCLASPRTGFCQRKPKRFLIPVTHHSAFSKRLVIGQKIWYHTGVKEEGESGVSSHSLDTPATSVDPRGAHPTPPSLRRRLGGDSLHQVACHFPSRAHCWPGAGGSRGRKGART